MRLSETFVDRFKRKHSVIVGMTQSGKTFFATRMLKRLQGQGAHTIFIDPKGEVKNLGVVCRTIPELMKALMAKERAIAYYTSLGQSDDLDRIVELLFAYKQKDGFQRIRRVIAIDEVQTFIGKGKSKAIEWIWTVGAGKGIIGMALTQRIQLLNETIWSQSLNKVLFKMEDRAQYLRSRNLDHYVDQLDFFSDPINEYYFYSTTGGNEWKVNQPLDNIDNNYSLDIKPPHIP